MAENRRKRAHRAAVRRLIHVFWREFDRFYREELKRVEAEFAAEETGDA